MIRKIELFFLSLWLLFVLIIIITAKIPFCFSEVCGFVGFEYLILNNIISLLCIISLIIGAVAYFDFIYQMKGSPELSFKITKIEKIDYEHLIFLTTYIIPLVCFKFESLRYQIVFFLIIVVIGIIYVRTDLFYANPILAMLQFRIYKVDGEFRNNETREARILISKEKLSKEDNVKYLKLDDRIYYAFRVKKND